MTDEQRKRLAELLARQKVYERERAIARTKAQILEEIPRFSERYVFADDEQSEKLHAFIDSLPFARPGWINIDKFSSKREFDPDEEDERHVWICFLSGDKELLDMNVGCTAADYFADFEDWQFLCPFTVLVYDDSFVFIDDNGDMTEILQID